MSPLPRPASYASRPMIIAILAVIGVIAVLIIMIQIVFPRGASRILGTYSAGYRDGYNAARGALTKRFPSLALETSALAGTVKEVRSDGFVMEVEGLLLDERVDGVGTTRTILVNDQTTIVQMEQKSAEDFQEELAVFNRQIRNSAGAAPPSLFTEKEMQLGDLKEGDIVTVQVSDGSNIALADNITAGSVSVSVKPPSPLPESAPLAPPQIPDAQ